MTEFTTSGIRTGTMLRTRLSRLPFSSSSPRDFWASIIWKASSITTGMNLTAVTNAKTTSRGTLIHFIICSSSSGEVVTKKRLVELIIARNRSA